MNIREKLEQLKGILAESSFGGDVVDVVIKPLVEVINELIPDDITVSDDWVFKSSLIPDDVDFVETGGEIFVEPVEDSQEDE